MGSPGPPADGGTCSEAGGAGWSPGWWCLRARPRSLSGPLGPWTRWSPPSLPPAWWPSGHRRIWRWTSSRLLRFHCGCRWDVSVWLCPTAWSPDFMKWYRSTPDIRYSSLRWLDVTDDEVTHVQVLLHDLVPCIDLLCIDVEKCWYNSYECKHYMLLNITILSKPLSSIPVLRSLWNVSVFSVIKNVTCHVIASLSQLLMKNIWRYCLNSLWTRHSQYKCVSGRFRCTIKIALNMKVLIIYLILHCVTLLHYNDILWHLGRWWKHYSTWS